MNKSDISALMKSNNITPTPIRVLVYECLESSAQPLSLMEIEEALQTVDKSSVSRSLNLFRSKDLIHFFNDCSGIAKYEVCKDPHHHSANDIHPHFYCKICGKTFCLSDQKIPEITLPEGFKLNHINFLISGTCKKCNC